MNFKKLSLIYLPSVIFLYINVAIILHLLIISTYGFKFDIPLMVASIIGTNKTITYLLLVHVISLSLGYLNAQSTVSILTLLLFIIKLGLSSIINNLLKKIDSDYIISKLEKILNTLLKLLENEFKNNSENEKEKLTPEIEKQKELTTKQKEQDIENEKIKELMTTFREQEEKLAKQKEQDIENEKIKKEEEHEKQLLSNYYERLEKTPKRFTSHHNNDDLNNDLDILKNNYDEMVKKCYLSKYNLSVEKEFNNDNITERYETPFDNSNLYDKNPKTRIIVDKGENFYNKRNDSSDTSGNIEDEKKELNKSEINKNDEKCNEIKTSPLNDDNTVDVEKCIDKLIKDPENKNENDNESIIPSDNKPITIPIYPPKENNLENPCPTVEELDPNDETIKERCEDAKNRIERFTKIIENCKNDLIKTTDEEEIKNINGKIKNYQFLIDNEKRVLADYDK